MLPTATLHVIDRLVTAVMTLVEAVAPSVNTPNLAEAAAQTLFFRLGQLVTHLIRVSIFGVRTSTKAHHPAPVARSTRLPRPAGAAASLPRRPGWLLAALPEIAPAVAADIHALLADPAIATLLDRAPALHRSLCPLLRSLGLEAPTPPRPPSSPTKPPAAPPRRPAPPPAAPPPAAPPPSPTPWRASQTPILATASKRGLPNPQPSHAVFIPVT